MHFSTEAVPVLGTNEITGVGQGKSICTDKVAGAMLCAILVHVYWRRLEFLQCLVAQVTASPAERCVEGETVPGPTGTVPWTDIEKAVNMSTVVRTLEYHRIWTMCAIERAQRRNPDRENQDELFLSSAVVRVLSH